MKQAKFAHIWAFQRSYMFVVYYEQYEMRSFVIDARENFVYVKLCMKNACKVLC